MISLKGKTAIITGASQGFGKFLAQQFLQAGAKIAICARDADLLKSAQNELLQYAENEDQIFSRALDVANINEIESFVDLTLRRYTRIDILVNNAGVYGPKGCIEEVDWQEWTRAIEINLYGPVLMCRALLQHFKLHKSGKIINLSGGGATAPLPRLSAYAASKAAIVRLTETIAHEASPFGIDVNAIAPGALNTRLLTEILAAGPEKVGNDFYQRSLKQKDEGGSSMERAAQLCLFLASEKSNGITGRLISAIWDAWEELPQHVEDLRASEIYTLRRIIPADRGESWGGK